ncbi:hypothetical protein HN799_05620 [Candidatus Woesearchaeota archaeon]|jgi:hypothetical protein|nr:hypothetical protein [Candidatus Latescibacterota bacterium]MBT7332722.1 hypothetical protein [Candidatus Woesearchaeota archaeon]
MRWAVLSLLFVGVGPLGAESKSRAEIEHFLATAIVLEVEDIGVGVSNPWKVILARKGQKVPTIFKYLDQKKDAKTRFGSEVVEEYSDSYRHELAAYELDKLWDLNVLPVAVSRRVNGRSGVLREWADEVQAQYGHGQTPPNLEKMRDWRHVIWLFDFLISNMDRRTRNFLMRPDWTPILIDHSLAFTTYQKSVRPLYRFPKEFVDRLERVDEGDLRKAMAPYLGGKQIDALVARRQNVLELVAARVASVGAEETFFLLENLRNSVKK